MDQLSISARTSYAASLTMPQTCHRFSRCSSSLHSRRVLRQSPFSLWTTLQTPISWAWTLLSSAGTMYKEHFITDISKTSWLPRPYPVSEDQRTINLQHRMPTIETNLVAREKPSPGVTPIVSEGGQEQSRPQSEGAYPAYLFSYWADSAQDSCTPDKAPRQRILCARRH